MAGRPDLAGRASQRASAGSDWARQPDPAGQGDDGAPPRPAPAPCAAWRGPGMVWTVGVGSGAPLRGRGPALLKKWGPYQPNLEDYWRHMTTKQGRGVTQAVAFDAATVGGAWVSVWGSIGELGAHYMCEVRFGSVLRFQLGVQKQVLALACSRKLYCFMRYGPAGCLSNTLVGVL